ncbi:tRNA (guanosine(46)-N7)-methyltransferase TrmB [Thermospira aquatica]|uniref:tRNA (guanine-N(7)-)-methyltransferase n=1 Tax=Thermospira aquatica TaxID=2828656 RepID=A0AAX3BGP5_9SPIR|nr:tRNA (guanosine(46)-N7)-methyltransferase TrmB [Thermospira aquatica]URA11199.1 tRNA (guanosine(46)-N7)-methyltransferase TrmB [Thermospira aquatica]
MERNRFPDIEREFQAREPLYSEWFPLLEGRRVVLDIGCGHGDFLIEKTDQSPESFFVGIEISRKRVAKTSHRLAKRNRKNYAVIHGDGEWALKVFFSTASVDEIHINFPDPWLRKRHWKNRLLRPSFVLQVIRVLKKGGKIFFVTDVEEYARYAVEVFRQFEWLQSVYPTEIVQNLYERFPTLFYQKMSPLRPIQYVCFEKIENSLLG